MKTCDNCVRSRKTQKNGHCIIMHEKPKELFCFMTEDEASRVEAVIVQYKNKFQGSAK